MVFGESSLGNFAYSLEGRRMTVNGEAVIAYLESSGSKMRKLISVSILQILDKKSPRGLDSV